MRKVYVALLGLFAIAIAVQFYLAAVGAFDKPQDDDSFAAHRINGLMVIPLLGVLATIAAAVAKLGGRTIGLTLLAVGLVILQRPIQVISEAFNTSAGDTTTASVLVFGLHAINGLAIIMLAGGLMRRARGSLAAPAPVEASRSGAV
ncbi:DUF6220 domain-containing protein [Micromonospora sp. CA-259024]|uniref:DUF6220 domain-containing protein n=1 Tax=Micromonospora sp. CA-259024 TaxID=3239965 RepID=UPI003D93A21D